MPGPLLMGISRVGYKPASFGEALSETPGPFLMGKKETGKGGEETEKPCEVPMPGRVTIWQHPAQETWAENRRKEECSA